MSDLTLFMIGGGVFMIVGVAIGFTILASSYIGDRSEKEPQDDRGDEDGGRKGLLRAVG